MDQSVNLQPYKIFSKRSALNIMYKFVQAIESRFDIVLIAITKAPWGILHSHMTPLMSKY